MALVLATAPTKEPVTVVEAKKHLRLEGTDEDDLVAALVAAVRQAREPILGRALITQTWELVLDRFPCNHHARNLRDYQVIKVPRPPLQSVESIKYIDTAGTERTLDPTAYRVDLKSEPGRVEPAYGLSWPDTLDTLNAVVVRFVAGYGGDETKVPEGIKRGFLLRIGDLYEHRESVNIGNIVNVLPAADALEEPFRVVTF